MHKTREVLRLAVGAKIAQREVSAALGISKGSVANIVRRAEAAGIGWPLPDDLDDVGLEARLFPPTVPTGTLRPVPDWSEIHRELSKKGVTLSLLWEEYRSAEPDGLGYSWFCELYRDWSRRVDVVMRQNHKAGEKLFSDFAGDTIPIYRPHTTEVAFEAKLFVAAMGISARVFAEAMAAEGLEDWIKGHADCFADMGAVPWICVPDNPKAVTTKADRYEPTLNRTFEEMAEHYGK